MQAALVAGVGCWRFTCSRGLAEKAASTTALEPQVQFKMNGGGHGHAITHSCGQNYEHCLILIQSQMSIQKRHHSKHFGEGPIGKGLTLSLAWMHPDTGDCLSGLPCLLQQCACSFT